MTIRLGFEVRSVCVGFEQRASGRGSRGHPSSARSARSARDPYVNPQPIAEVLMIGLSLPTLRHCEGI